MIYCSRCGAECDSYYNYCTQCGNKMVKEDVFSSAAESLADACLKVAFVMLKVLAVFTFAVMVIAGACAIGRYHNKFAYRTKEFYQFADAFRIEAIIVRDKY